jgi:hypothetical protein
MPRLNSGQGVEFYGKDGDRHTSGFAPTYAKSS